ncbi:NUDIX domain-containing protein [Patescibacteria group bacterium]|nr:NUDIX domain-containing protein [Patescibacteria group bacterium]
MQIDFPIFNNQYQEFCINCHAANPSKIIKDGKTFYECNNCGQISPRLIVIDPKIVWGIDPQTKEYWHESVGIFISNDQNEVLFFQRNKFPFLLTIPAGHLDVGEDSQQAIMREVKEETGLILDKVQLFAEEDLVGDQCRRGADKHKWHLFVARVHNSYGVSVSADEGVKPVWLNFKQAEQKDLTFPVKYFMDKFGDKLYGVQAQNKE